MAPWFLIPPTLFCTLYKCLHFQHCGHCISISLLWKFHIHFHIFAPSLTCTLSHYTRTSWMCRHPGFNPPRFLFCFFNREETKWRHVTADLLRGTISVFDIDTQVRGQSRTTADAPAAGGGSIQGFVEWILRLLPFCAHLSSEGRFTGTGPEPHKAVCEERHSLLISLL